MKEALGPNMELELELELATANRSRVSIRGRPCKNFPHIQFDHHAEFDRCFSYCVRACSKSQTFWGRWAILGLRRG